MNELEKAIIKIISETPGIKAKDIAAKIGCEKKIVNAALYGSLSSRCRQDSSYKWYSNDLEIKIVRSISENPGIKAKDIAAKIGCSTNAINAALYGSLSARYHHDSENKWYINEFEKTIILILKETPRIKARNIATKIGCKRKAVNAALYGSLCAYCYHDTGYTWNLNEFGKSVAKIISENLVMRSKGATRKTGYDTNSVNTDPFGWSYHQDSKHKWCFYDQGAVLNIPNRTGAEQMQRYRNLGGNSGVESYRIGVSYIDVKFLGNERVYRYSHRSAGWANVREMKRLARRGVGLNAFINCEVYSDYES